MTERGRNARRPMAEFLSAKIRRGFQPEKRIPHRAGAPEATEGHVVVRKDYGSRIPQPVRLI